MKISCYISRKVVKANHSESIVRLSEIHSIIVIRKHEMHITPEVKDYTNPVVCKNSLTDFSSVSNPTFIISKYSNVISCKFKAVKFTLE